MNLMRTLWPRACGAVLFTTSALGAWPIGVVHADQLRGYVVSVADGDTLTLLVDRQQHRVRIAGIDAPEKAQPFGAKSQTNLDHLAFNKDAIADCPKKDRYGRWVCKVTVNGVDVGLQQVADGMAWWYRKYANEQSPQDRTTYEQAESMAQLKRYGLWADTNPIPPWEWRRR